MTPDQHLIFALATALAYSSKLVERHPEHAEIVADVATILGAAAETGDEGAVDDSDRVTLHQAAIITATVEAWTPHALPHLDQARQLLEWAAAQPHSARPPFFVSSKTTEGARLARSLAAAIGNMARAAGALSAVLSEVEGSRFKDCFDVNRLLSIGQAAGMLTATMIPLRLPDLSNPEL